MKPATERSLSTAAAPPLLLILRVRRIFFSRGIGALALSRSQAAQWSTEPTPPGAQRIGATASSGTGRDRPERSPSPATDPPSACRARLPSSSARTPCRTIWALHLARREERPTLTSMSPLAARSTRVAPPLRRTEICTPLLLAPSTFPQGETASGTAVVNNGTWNITSPQGWALSLGNGSNSTGSLTVSNNGAVNISATPSSDAVGLALGIGGGSGSVTVDGGSIAFKSGAGDYIQIGAYEGSGDMTVKGVGRYRGAGCNGRAGRQHRLADNNGGRVEIRRSLAPTAAMGIIWAWVKSTIRRRDSRSAGGDKGHGYRLEWRPNHPEYGQ